MAHQEQREDALARLNRTMETWMVHGKGQVERILMRGKGGANPSHIMFDDALLGGIHHYLLRVRGHRFAVNYFLLTERLLQATARLLN